MPWDGEESGAHAYGNAILRTAHKAFALNPCPARHTITLATNRLTLRPFRADHIDAYAAIRADPEVMHHLTGQPLPRDDAWRQTAMLVGHWLAR